MSHVIEKSFSLHPSILYSIINEQAGDPVKAMTELVMNSMDAGATEIHFDFSATDFSIRDNGVGFKNAEEVESFFGTFGTPHEHNDRKYGKFRLGRGQVFSLASTEWRSGHFGMNVDLAGKTKTDILGYELLKHDDFQDGCVITGKFYSPLNIHEGIQNISLFNNQISEFIKNYSVGKTPFTSLIYRTDFMSRLIRAIGIVECNVYINGVMISNVENLETYHETDFAKFYLSKSLKNFNVHFNKGIYISHENSYAPLIVDFKVSPNLNLARNQVNSDCPIYKQALSTAFDLGFNAYLKNEKWANGMVESLLSDLHDYMYLGVGRSDPYHDNSTFVSHITAENVQQFLNRHPVKFYKDGTFKSLPFLEAVALINKNLDEYVFNGSEQIEAIKRSSQQTLKSCLQVNGFDKTLVFDEYGLLAITANFKSLNRFLELHFPDYAMKFSMQMNEVFWDMDDLDTFKISKKPTAKKETQKVDSSNLEKMNQSKQDLMNITFNKKGLIDPESTTEIIEKKIDVLNGYFAHIKNILKDHFRENDVSLPESWLISSDKPLMAFFCGNNYALSGEYEEAQYIFLNSNDLKDGMWTRNFMAALFNDVETAIGLAKISITCLFPQSFKDKLNEFVYDNDGIHERIHNVLDEFIETHSLYELFNNAENDLKYLDIKKVKFKKSERRHMKEVMDFIDKIGAENPDLFSLLQPELKKMEQIYIEP